MKPNINRGKRREDRIINQNKYIDSYGIRILIYLGFKFKGDPDDMDKEYIAKNLNEIMKFDEWTHTNPAPWEKSLRNLKELSLIISNGTKDIQLTPNHPNSILVKTVAEVCLKRRIWEDVKRLTPNEYLAIGMYLVNVADPESTTQQTFKKIANDIFKPKPFKEVQTNRKVPLDDAI